MTAGVIRALCARLCADYQRAEALRFEVLLDTFLALQVPLETALREASAETLAKRVGNSSTGNPDEAVGSFLPARTYFEC